jgi:hypothetical protein
MADSKISALTSGNPAQSGDEIPIARGGANYKITAGSIASLGGDVDGPASSVDNQIALFDSTTGKLIKAATTTGVLKASSGVIAAATSGTDYVAPAGAFSGLSWQSVQTTGFTAVAFRAYPCNTTSAAFTVTLPASPSAGDQITLTDYAGTFATNNLTINPNGGKVNGSASNYLVSQNRWSLQLVYVDSTQGWLISGTTNLYIPPPISIDYLVVAGGGGGGGTSNNSGGGGGAGGYRTGTGLTISAGVTYTIVVGTGGAGAGSGVPGSSGGNSYISGSPISNNPSSGNPYTNALVAFGGGGGAISSATPGAANTGVSGGSGGGSTGNNATGGSGNTPSTTPSQGNNGGGSAELGGGGGGGAGGTGGTGTSGTGGNGGNGIQGPSFASDYGGAGPGGTPSTGYFAGGGGASGTSTAGTGGYGGGAAGKVSGAGNNASANTGGGGGATNGTPRGNGGSGIVIIAYPATYAAAAATTGSPTVTVSGGNRIYTFTGNGSITW